MSQKPVSKNTRLESMLQPTFEYEVNNLPTKSGPPPSPVAGISPTFDLREIVRITRRRWWIIAGAVATLLLMAGVFILVVTPRYTATSTVLIDPHRSHVVDNGDQPQSSTFGTDHSVVASQVLIVESVAVLQRVVEELHLVDDPEFGPFPSFFGRIVDFFSAVFVPAGDKPRDVAKAKTIEFLQQRLKVARQGTSFVIDIDVSSESPEKAAKIANVVADSYFYALVQSKYNTNKIAASWLNQQLDDLKSRVQASDKAVEEFRSTHNLITTQGQTVNDQQLTDLNNKLIEAHVQTAEARAKYEQVQNIARTHADPGTLDRALASDVIRQLRTQYADVAKNVADVSSKYGPQHPLVANANAQLRATQRLIDQEVQRILDNTRDAYQVAQSREEALKNSLSQLQSASTDLSKSQVRLRELQREADANRTLYESFLARYKQTSAQESSGTARFAYCVSRGCSNPAFVPKSLIDPGTGNFTGIGCRHGPGLHCGQPRSSHQVAATGRRDHTAPDVGCHSTGRDTGACASGQSRTRGSP